MSSSYQADSDISLDDVHYSPFAPGEHHYGLLGDVRGKRVLELACGGAQNSVALAKWGACVVALDISSEQLSHARALRSGVEVEFELVLADMESPTMFRDGSFDLLISSFGWEFIPDIAICLRRCAALLRDGGQLVMSTVHPLSAFDWSGNERALRVPDYFNPPVEVWDEPVPDGHRPGLTFFRTIEELVTVVTSAGLVVDRLLEPYPVSGQTSPYAGRYWADHWDRLTHVPFAVVISARKIRLAD